MGWEVIDPFSMRFMSAAFSFAMALIGAQSANAADLRITWVSNGTVLQEITVDLAKLDALPQRTIVTATPWTTGETTFSGPELAALAKLGPGMALSADLHALNDYSASVPAQDWSEYHIILATRINREVPRVYQKGPFWLMYPLNEMPIPVSQVYISRMVWQVDSVQFNVK